MLINGVEYDIRPGADLRNAILTGADLTGAKVNKTTKMPWKGEPEWL